MICLLGSQCLVTCIRQARHQLWGRLGTACALNEPSARSVTLSVASPDAPLSHNTLWLSSDRRHRAVPSCPERCSWPAVQYPRRRPAMQGRSSSRYIRTSGRRRPGGPASTHGTSPFSYIRLRGPGRYGELSLSASTRWVHARADVNNRSHHTHVTRSSQGGHVSGQVAIPGPRRRHLQDDVRVGRTQGRHGRVGWRRGMQWRWVRRRGRSRFCSLTWRGRRVCGSRRRRRWAPLKP
jgi:hypothetical protein